MHTNVNELYIVPYLLILSLYKKTPKFGDELHIKDEMKLVNVFILMSFFGVFLWLIVAVFFFKHSHYVAIASYLYSGFWIFLIGLTHTRWVVNSYKAGVWIKNTKNASPKLKVTASEFDSDPSNKQNVLEILQNERAFDAFVVHLNAEYSLGLYTYCT